MNLRSFSWSALLLWGSLFLVNKAYAQQNRSGQATVRAIDQAFGEQQINLEQKILYQLYAGFQPQKVPGRFGIRTQKPQAIKCATPIIIEFLQHQKQISPQATAEVYGMIGAPRQQARQAYISGSGKFTIFYTTTGADAVPSGDANTNGIPDYVEWTAIAADSSWRHEVENLGFLDPVTGSADPYAIYIEDLGAQGFYGFTSTGQDRGYADATYIVINSQLDQAGFTNNADPNPVRGAIRVTIAHELKHAIQYINSRWYTLPGDNQSPHSLDWSEMDATSMEELVYDPVNDYYNYLGADNSIFLAEDHSVPVPYSGVTWFLYFIEKYDSSLWRSVWQRIQQQYEKEQGQRDPNYLSMVEAVRLVLQQQHNQSFQTAFIESQLWHFASGPAHSSPAFGFEESQHYPTPTINTTFMGADSLATQKTLPGLSAHYVSVSTDQSLDGNVKVRLTASEVAGGLGILAYLNNGSVLFKSFSNSYEGTVIAETNWSWEQVARLGIVVANARSDSSLTYTLRVTNTIPEELTIGQNYPNPFSGNTTIPLGLPKAMHVQIKLYDTLGRLVQTPVDKQFSAGEHLIPINMANLASGVYFYRVKADKEVFIKKMLLVK